MYATITDIEERMGKVLTASEAAQATVLLEDAAVMIDQYNADASPSAKKIVSCRMVMRALAASDGIPIGATQGSISALGYAQSWTVGNGSTGELYLGRQDKQLLGSGKIGSYSPTEDLCAE